jgi:hypothetical protein
MNETIRQVALQSNKMIYTPGILRWAINGYKFNKDRKNLRKVFVDGFNLPDKVVHRLLTGDIPHKIVGSEVHFEFKVGVKPFVK